jgi:Sap, sulfolipid-1-addressing protein
MAAVWAPLTPLILAGLILPTFLIGEILLLQSEKGPHKAAAFVGGFATTKFVQGVVFGLLFSGVAWGLPKETRSSITGVMLLIAAAVFYAFAVRSYLHRNEVAGIDRIMGAMSGLTPWRAFGLGVVGDLTSLRLWVFTLGAVTAIQEDRLPLLDAALIFLGFILLSLSPMIALALIPFLAPDRSDRVLAAIRGWLLRKAYWVMLVFGALVGTAMIWIGLRKLGVL